MRDMVPWFLLSLLLHVPLALFLVGIAGQHAADELDRRKPESSESFSLSLAPREEDEKDNEQKEEQKEGQFVSMPKPAEQQEPDEAKFRDQYDSKTDKPTVNRDPPSQKPGSAGPEQPSRTQKPQKQKKEDSQKRENQEPSKQKSPAAETGVAEDVEGLVKGESKSEEKSEQSNRQQLDSDKLFPSFENTRADSSGGSNSVDYLRDIPEGEKTLLNRKKSRYWSFFHRIKKQIAQHWSPVSEYRVRDPTGKVYGKKDRFSKLEVTLNGDGTIRKLYLSKASGLEFLDDEAISSLQKAAPFRNPPEGLKDKDGLIRFSFGFYLDFKRGTFRALRLRRRQ